MAKGKGRSQEYDNIHEAKEKLRDEPRGTDLKEASSVNVQPENGHTCLSKSARDVSITYRRFTTS